MKLFRCSCAGQPLLHFENTGCGSCGRLVGFVPARLELVPFMPVEDDEGVWRDDAGGHHRPCANRVQHGACNWTVPADDPEPFCEACRMNRLVPDLSVRANLPPWRVLEAAKRRCLFTLAELGLPLSGVAGVPPLGFRFMTARDSDSNFERPLPGAAPVVTGHENGIVTIDLAEADAVARTRTQVAMAEGYRTPLGHFRHETGHYAWTLFGALSAEFPERFRARFGDERADYGHALGAHYARGPAPDWRIRHVSAYASAHPWEDFAETWAHYLHIVDALETQQSFAAVSAPAARGTTAVALPFAVGFGRDADHDDFDAIVRMWIDATLMLNALNRSMGLPDPYPFVLNDAVIEKLRFVHEELLALHGGR